MCDRQRDVKTRDCVSCCGCTGVMKMDRVEKGKYRQMLTALTGRRKSLAIQR